MRRTWRALSIVSAGLVLVLAPVVALLCTPKPLFAYHLTHGQVALWSDRPIAPEVAGVIDDATRRLKTSTLYAPSARFRIFICNDEWRLKLYSHRPFSHVGGYTDTFFTGGDVFLRRSEIAANRLIPPSGWTPAMTDRPLSYYFAHEMTHAMEGRAFGRVLVRYPQWVREGYADYIGKGGDFDLRENARLLRAGDPRLDFKRSGLYRRFHLEVAYLLDRKGWTVERLFASPPDEEALDREILSDLAL